MFFVERMLFHHLMNFYYFPLFLCFNYSSTFIVGRLLNILVYVCGGKVQEANAVQHCCNGCFLLVSWDDVVGWDGKHGQMLGNELYWWSTKPVWRKGFHSEIFVKICNYFSGWIKDVGHNGDGYVVLESKEEYKTCSYIKYKREERRM